MARALSAVLVLPRAIPLHLRTGLASHHLRSGGGQVIPRAELAEMLADMDLSDAAIMAVVDADAELAALESGIDGAPDADARRVMVAELRGML